MPAKKIDELLNSLSEGLIELHDAPIHHSSTLARNERIESLMSDVQDLKLALMPAE